MRTTQITKLCGKATKALLFTSHDTTYLPPSPSPLWLLWHILVWFFPHGLDSVQQQSVGVLWLAEPELYSLQIHTPKLKLTFYLTLGITDRQGDWEWTKWSWHNTSCNTVMTKFQPEIFFPLKLFFYRNFEISQTIRQPHIMIRLAHLRW